MKGTPLWTVLTYGGAVTALYFLVAMMSALIHQDPEARARLQAAGLAVGLLLMMAGAFLRPTPPGTKPTQTQPPRYPSRVPMAEPQESIGASWSGDGTIRL